jgi:excisionase family DNA binding protein
MTAPGQPPRALPAAGGRSVSVSQAATMLGLSKMSVYRLIHTGALPHAMVGRQFRIPLRSLDEFRRQALPTAGCVRAIPDGSTVREVTPTPIPSRARGDRQSWGCDQDRSRAKSRCPGRDDDPG